MKLALIWRKRASWVVVSSQVLVNFLDNFVRINFSKLNRQKRQRCIRFFTNKNKRKKFGHFPKKEVKMNRACSLVALIIMSACVTSGVNLSGKVLPANGPR